MDILAENLLILASAGSGKTFQLGNRVIALIARGVDPQRIVALTFTRKAAGEFADAVLTQLAKAASDVPAASQLRESIHLPDADFQQTLQRVVHALPRFTLGTMDGFFAKIVRGFQYELGLTGGKFDLLEGPRAEALSDDLLAGILGDSLALEHRDEFFHAFRRATIGKEDHGILKTLRDFITRWQTCYQESRNVDWGPATMADVDINDWYKQKSVLAAKVLEGLDGITFTRKGQKESLEKEIENLHKHSIGDGSLGKQPSALLASIVDAVATQGSSLTVKSYKEFTIDGPTGDALRSMVELAARCELAAALSRTRAIRDLIAVYDALCASRLRKNGLLNFNDVKILMGDWSRNEDARLRREAVDFRLDARIDHWLLDEFQDTSRADWTGLLPLIDEAATNDEGTMFIVGDRKQAIYAWRGGDVSLFDEVISRYSKNLTTESMVESWRSCPEVLSLVNQVCGDTTTLKELFGSVADQWIWQNHVSADPLTSAEKRGEARVEVVGDWDDRLERLEQILHELGVGQLDMTCGVLLRGNEKVREVADHLRTRGFDVIEEGRREPAKDNPVGILIAYLLQWLANPADTFALEVIEMSPLAPLIRAKFGNSWHGIWENLTTMVSRVGFVGMIADLIADSWPGWSDFGRRRAGDLTAALATLDAQGSVSLKEAADWIMRLEVAQNPGVAAVQVMTYHKAKGLGFDVVVLPEIPDTPVPQAQYFDIAEGDGWLTQTPPKWARTILPEMRDAEVRWAEKQKYESFCMLYVALTRAKRALHVLLQTPAPSAEYNKPSLANWLLRSLGADGQTGVVYQQGASNWTETVKLLEPGQQSEAPQPPGSATPRRGRMTPSAAQTKDHAPVHSPAGMKFGSDVHALLEGIAWADESPTVLPAGETGDAVTRLLRNPSLHEVFERRGRSIDLWREQSISAILDDRLLSGVIDRLHIHRAPDGSVTRVEIIDFKTDAVKDPAQLLDRHAGQMSAYRTAMQQIYPDAEIVCGLLSVRHASLVFLTKHGQ